MIASVCLLENPLGAIVL